LQAQADEVFAAGGTHSPESSREMARGGREHLIKLVLMLREE
jgi:hypothetical protein